MLPQGRETTVELNLMARQEYINLAVCIQNSAANEARGAAICHGADCSEGS